MIIHLLAARKAPDGCPPLRGKKFNIKLDPSVQGIDGATVEIADDLTYTIKTPNRPDQTGRLKRISDIMYKYREPGPPRIKGRLICLDGKWVFADHAPNGGGESGELEPVSEEQ